jgi:hypothetical protein
VIDISIAVSQHDVANLDAAFGRLVERFKGNIPRAVEKTTAWIIVSLRARTKESKKTRNIVKNPGEYKGIHADKFVRVHGHIQAWYKEHGGTKYKKRKLAWLPPLVEVQSRNPWAIERLMQHGKARYTPIRYMDLLKRHGKSEAKAVAQVRNPKTYNMLKFKEGGRRGLARASWGWMLGKLGASGGSGAPGRFAGTYSVDRYGNGNDGTTAIISANKLAYIRKAMTRGDITTVLSSATKSILADLERAKKRAIGGAS